MKFTLKPQQVDFIGSTSQFPAYIAGVGTGKSTSLIAKAMLHSEESKDNLGVIVRKQFTDLRNSTIKDFQDYTGLKVNESTHEVKLKNGSTIVFIHGDVLDSLKNINCGWFAIEQAEEFPDDTAFQFLKMRLRRKVLFRSGFVIANTNGHNWIWKTWKNQQLENHELIEATTYDFADIHVPDYIKNLETLPKKLFKRYVMNSWEEAEGLVYDEFIESRDVIEPFEIPSDWEKGFVLDHGYRNPTAVNWYAIDYDGNVYLYQEHYETEKPVSHHSEQIKKLGQQTDGIADPSIFSLTQSRGSYMVSIADEYREFGINLRPSIRSREDASIARVNEFFKAGRIKIFKNCVNTIREISNWKWRSVRPQVQQLNKPEEPEDKDNHTCDNLKYLIASRFGIPEKQETTPVKKRHTIYAIENGLEQEPEEAYA